MLSKPEIKKASKLPPSPTALLPGDKDSSQFFTLFPCWWDFIYADVPAYGESPSWLTQTAYPLDARNAWNAYHDQNVLLGVRFDVTTWYFLFDIDRGSEYHPSKSLSSYKRLIGIMEDAGFTRYMVVSSSESGGLHVYFILPEPASTAVLAEAVDELLREKGFDIGDGTLEVFPNVKGSADSLYKAHRLPLQRNSFVLDPVTFEPRHQDISAFLREASLDASGQDGEAIRELLSRTKVKRRGKRTATSFSTEGDSLRAHLVECLEEGWTDYGQTNHKLWKMAMYGRVFLRLEGEALTSYIVNTAKASPGYQDFCRHQHEIERRARDWMRFAMKHYYPYGMGWVDRDTTYWRRDWQHTALGMGILPDAKTPQEETHNETLARVRYVVEELKKSGELPKTVTARVAAIREKVREIFGGGATSLETLYKEEYRRLWHPTYEDKYPILPNPSEEAEEVSGVMVSKPDRQGHYATLPNRLYIRALPPRTLRAQAGAREACADVEKSVLKPAESGDQPQAKTHSTAHSTTRTYNSCLSADSGANAVQTDKEILSFEPPRAHVLPGAWCRVVGYARGLQKGVVVLVDSVSSDGKTVTVLTWRGVALSGIPPDVLEVMNFGENCGG